MIKIFSNYGQADDNYRIVAEIANSDWLQKTIYEAILVEAAQLIAKKYVKDNYAEIASKLSQQAIANLAVAAAGKAIAEEIKDIKDVKDIRKVRNPSYIDWRDRYWR